MSERFCINCKHYQPATDAHLSDDQRAEFALCAASSMGRAMHLVDGRPLKLSYCSTERGQFLPCGPDGNRFEAKEAQAA